MESPPKKPQDQNFELQLDITDLNFRQPLKFDHHPYKNEIHLWDPPLFIGSAIRQKKLNKNISEINDYETFNAMINILKKTPMWAVDLEHDDLSYSGITCLIQISTAGHNFLIDPFELNKEIKEDLKPLLESKHHIKVLHSSSHDMRWLQRDFNIFAWPVVDTQILFRYIKKLQNCEKLEGVGNVNVISLDNLLNYYDIPPCYKDIDNHQLSNFKQRPLPDYLIKYAIKDTIHLLHAVRKMRSDFENNTECERSFEDLLKDCANKVATFLYTGKIYNTVEDDIEEEELTNKDCRISTFTLLHAWRDDLAKMLDVNPMTILHIDDLINLSRKSRPVTKATIKKYTINNKSRFFKYLLREDVLNIQEIIGSGKYKKMTRCVECGYYPYFITGTRINVCDSASTLILDWDPILGCVGYPKAPDMEDILKDRSLQLVFANYTRAMNKLPYSKSNQIGLYNFSAKEMNQFIKEIKNLILRVQDLLKCFFCKKPVQDAIVYFCDCTSPSLWCRGCWKPCQSFCSQHTRIPFETANTIVEECRIYLKNIVSSHCVLRFTKFPNFLRNCELETMCYYCFNHLEQTVLVLADKGGYSWSAQCCYNGCCELYTKCYGQKEDPIRLLVFDKICEEFNTTLSDIFEYCQRNKTVAKGDHPDPRYGTMSHFRKKALKGEVLPKPIEHSQNAGFGFSAVAAIFLIISTVVILSGIFKP